MSLIKSQLIQNITDQNPHLYIKDVERIVNTIFSEITKSLFPDQDPVGKIVRLSLFNRFDFHQQYIIL